MVKLGICGAPCGVVEAYIAFVRRVVIGGQGKAFLYPGRCGECRLFLYGGVDLDFFEVLQVALMEEGKFLRGVTVAVQKNETVGGVIIFAVKREELLLGQVRYEVRIAPGLEAVAVFGEQRLLDDRIQHAVGR